jgi:hypothetical protein
LTLYNFTLREDVPEDDIIDRKPLVDEFGQWIPENWPGKAHDEQELRELWAADTLQPIDYGFCPMGGDRSQTLRRTGFFRVEKLDGRAWISSATSRAASGPTSRAASTCSAGCLSPGPPG